MKPYWTSADGNLTIYHGDARDVLPELDLSAVDLVLTDPPYGIAGGSGNVNKKRGKGNYRAHLWNDTPEYVRDVCVHLVRYCIETVGRVIITPGQIAMWDYPRPVVMGDFYCDVAAGYSAWGRNCTNPIFYYGKDPRSGAGQSPTGRMYGRLNGRLERADWHPCPKPLPDWQWLLCKGSLEGETVLDPFAGAFTTLLAAQRTGRKAVGIEIEEFYAEKGAERLSQLSLLPIEEVEQGQGFAQVPMFDGVAALAQKEPVF